MLLLSPPFGPLKILLMSKKQIRVRKTCMGVFVETSKLSELPAGKTDPLRQIQ